MIPQLLQNHARAEHLKRYDISKLDQDTLGETSPFTIVSS